MSNFSCRLNTYLIEEKSFTIRYNKWDNNGEDLKFLYKNIREISNERAGHTNFMDIKLKDGTISVEIGKSDVVHKVKKNLELYRERKAEKTKSTIKELRERVTKLEGLVEQLLYAPGGPLYQEAYERFKKNIN